MEMAMADWRDNLAAAMGELGNAHMPFGRYGPQKYPPHGMPLYDLPDEYLVWFKGKGFPAGKLGRMMETVYEIRMAGAEVVFEPLRAAAGGRRPQRPPRKKSFDFSKSELPLKDVD